MHLCICICTCVHMYVWACMPKYYVHMKFGIGSCLLPYVGPRDWTLVIRLGSKRLLPSSLLFVSTFQFYYYLLDEFEDMVSLFKSDIRNWALTPSGIVGCLTPQSSFLLHCRIVGEERAACLLVTLPSPFPYRWVFPRCHIFLVVWKFPAHRALCWDLK